MTKIKHVYGNVMKVAIPLTQRVRTMVDGQIIEQESDFFPNENFPVVVVLQGVGNRRTDYIAQMDGNVATIVDNGKLNIGTYNIEIIAVDNNEDPVRFKVKEVLCVVDATIDAGIEAGIEFNVETYTLEGAVFFYAKGDKGDKGDQGVGIASVEQIQTSEVSEGINIVRVTLTNGVTSDFEIRNGSKPSIVVENETLKFN